MELLTRAIAVTEAEDFAPTIVDTAFHQYLDDTFTYHIPSDSITPNKHATTPIINSPPKKRFRVSSSQLTEDRHLRKRDGTHMFQLDSHSKARKLDFHFPYINILPFMQNNMINDCIL